MLFFTFSITFVGHIIYFDDLTKVYLIKLNRKILMCNHLSAILVT